MAWRALIVGSIGPASAAVINAWTEAGNSVAGFWRGSTKSRGQIRRDRRLAWLVPRWSIASLARKHGFSVRDVSRLATWPQAAAEAKATGADVLISVYFMYLIPGQVLDHFPSRAVNFHPAPLPRYRGPRPIAAMVRDRSILTDGCMTLHEVNQAFDEGPIIAREPVAFPADLSIARYNLDLARAAARLTGGALQRYLDGELTAVPQDDRLASYAGHEPAAPLSAEMTVDEIRWQCHTTARTRPIAIEVEGSPGAVGFERVVGPPTGEPPAVSLLSVEFDARDGRVRVRRKPPFNRQYRKVRDLVAFARTPIR